MHKIGGDFLLIYDTIKNTKIYSDFSNSDNVKWFNRMKYKFITHIDTLYFSVYVDCANDWKLESVFGGVKRFLGDLEAYKEACLVSKSCMPVFDDVVTDVIMSPFKHAKMYYYNFGIKDKFDVFVAKTLPNGDTPPIFVQLRSISLWLDGVYNAFDIVTNCLEKILNKYGITILKCTESRCDYAYHTNYIQDFVHFFPMDRLSDMQVSNLKRWDYQGYFYDDKSVCDYFTLGRRKSNNIFFRVYNKVKEVIEMGYKHFFFPIWLHEGLINEYDFWVLSKVAEMGNSFDNVDRCRALFYLEYGTNADIKSKIQSMISNPDTPLCDYTNICKGLVPDITVVCNIEFQVKRKFFDRLECSSDSDAEFLEWVKLFQNTSIDCEGFYRRHMYEFIGHAKDITNFITYNTIRFVKYKNKKDLSLPKHKRPMADFWVRLRSCKPYELVSSGAEYCRKYQSKIDTKLMLKSVVSKLATYSAYVSYDEDCPLDAQSTANDVLNHLNDNDLAELYYKKSTLKRMELRGVNNIDIEDTVNDVDFTQKQLLIEGYDLWNEWEDI